MLTYQNVSQDEVTSVLGELRLHGISATPANPNSWTITGFGIRAQVDYNSTSSTLRVAIQQKPFLVSDAMIDSKIKEALGR